MSTDFPPPLPCPSVCAYGDCGGRQCGGCCGCFRACHLEYDVAMAYRPMTREEADIEEHWSEFKQRTAMGHLFEGLEL